MDSHYELGGIMGSQAFLPTKTTLITPIPGVSISRQLSIIGDVLQRWGHLSKWGQLMKAKEALHRERYKSQLLPDANGGPK